MHAQHVCLYEEKVVLCNTLPKRGWNLTCEPLNGMHKFNFFYDLLLICDGKKYILPNKQIKHNQRPSHISHAWPIPYPGTNQDSIWNNSP